MRSLSTSLFLLLLGGCTIGGSLRYNVPINRFETPEVAGRTFGVSTEASVAGVQEVVLGKPKLPGSTYEFREKRQINTTHTAGLSASVGILESTEAVMRYRVMSPFLYGLKYQFKGKGRAESSSGLKMAVMALGGHNKIGSGDSRDGNSYGSRANVSMGELDFLTGVRLSESFMIFGVTSFNYSGVKASMSDRGAESLRTKGWSRQLGQTVGIEHPCSRLRCKWEAGVAQLNYADDIDAIHGQLGFAAELNW